MDDLWNVFTSTGKVSDYLNYKKQEHKGNIEFSNEASNQRVDNTRTDSGRER